MTVIMAGGQARRLGGGKANIKLGGKRLIDHVSARAIGYGWPVFIGVRTRGQIASPGFTQIEDAKNIDGPLAGIIAGLRWADARRCSHVLFLGCDMPFLPRNLGEVLLRSSGASGSIAAASSLGRLHPLASLWPVGDLEKAERAAGDGARALKAVLAACGYEAVDWDVKSGTGENLDPFFNINTPDDLKKGQKLLPPI